MYKGFQLTDEFLKNEFLNDFTNREKYKRIGEENKKEINVEIKQKLDEYLLPNGKIDASELQNDWFPEVGSHIFLSHSHEDKDNALILSGFLKEHFGIKVFIDSCVWGYAEDLLKKINNKYNLQPNNTYHYSNSNWSASNVYLMLASALNKMIDNTECILFLNTPNSLNTSDVEKANETRTGSPWIYSEINTTQIIRKQKPRRLIMESVKKGEFQNSIDESVGYSYKADITHLKEITKDHIDQWFQTCYCVHWTAGKHLDSLYKIVG